MADIERAQRLKALGNDPAFQELLEGVRAEQVAIFTRPGSKLEEREEAHTIIRALSRIEGHITSACNSLDMAKRSKGQDRNGD